MRVCRRLRASFGWRPRDRLLRRRRRLVATAVSASQINLTWSDNAANETGFVIERCQGAGCSNFALITPVGANTTSYNNTGLTASTSYSYRVAATNGAGTSPYSNTASATTSGRLPTSAVPDPYQHGRTSVHGCGGTGVVR